MSVSPSEAISDDPSAAEALARFLDAADRAGLTVEVRRFAQGTHTAADAAAAIGCDVAAIVKSVVLVARRGVQEWPVLVLTSGAHRAELGAVAAAVGCDSVRQARPYEVLAATGYRVGAVAPLGHPQAIPTWIDTTLLGREIVYAAAGTADSITAMDPAELAAASAASAIDFGASGGARG